MYDTIKVPNIVECPWVPYISISKRGVGVALFSGSPAKARGESGAFYHMRNVKGIHEVDTTVACTEAHPHSSEFVTVAGTYTVSQDCRVYNTRLLLL